MADQINLMETDPEFLQRFGAFAFQEVVNEIGFELDDKTRNLVILATLIGCQAVDEYKVMLPAALDGAVTPIEVKEMVYQATPYVGIGRMHPFLLATNEVMMEKGIKLPLEGQETTTMENRLEKGAETQVKIFGERMADAWKAGGINKWLADNCFGDYYTRTGLDLKQREMLTFCFLSAQGGCESQVMSHALGNMVLGNDKEFLMKVVAQAVPYMGYPRSLNAITGITKAEEIIKGMTK